MSIASHQELQRLCFIVVDACDAMSRSLLRAAALLAPFASSDRGVAP